MKNESIKSLTFRQRQHRRFSESFKRNKVSEIQAGVSRISEVARLYQVSTTSVHRWITAYGSTLEQTERLIMETKSDTTQLLVMKKKLAELERAVGQKQLEIDFLNKLIDLAGDHFHTDLKKTFSTKPSTTSSAARTKTRSQ